MIRENASRILLCERIEICIILQADLHHINQSVVNIHLLHATVEKYHQPPLLTLQLPTCTDHILHFVIVKTLLYANHYRTVPDKIC